MKRTALRIGIFCAVLAAAAGTAAGISRKTSDLQQKQPEILSLPVDSGGEKEYLIPSIEKFVPTIDLEQNKMIINPIKGMLD